MKRLLNWSTMLAIVGMLASCARAPLQPAPVWVPDTPADLPAGIPTDVPAAPAAGPVREQSRSRWVPVDWTELPGWDGDALDEAWQAWLRGCARPVPPWVALCQQVRLHSIADVAQQRAWMMQHLQPYRVETKEARETSASAGLLTAYYEPVYAASREPAPGFGVPLYAPPAGLVRGQPWYSRQEIDTLPAAQDALRGRALVYLADPVDALVLQIQGSGRLRVTEPDGTQRWRRLAYAGTNEQPYRSVGRWLLDQGAVRDASWPGIKAWLAANPQRQQELLWANPRVVFFREEALSDLTAQDGPRGAQGVPLTPARSIAVDPGSIPYGTPVWLVSDGPTLRLRRLVLAQDTGSAIVGAVRADYFMGWGDAAGELAGRLKQPLQLWALWPR